MTTISLPDGSTIALTDWIDDSLFGVVGIGTSMATRPAPFPWAHNDMLISFAADVLDMVFARYGKYPPPAVAQAYKHCALPIIATARGVQSLSYKQAVHKMRDVSRLVRELGIDELDIVESVRSLILNYLAAGQDTPVLEYVYDDQGITDLATRLYDVPEVAINALEIQWRIRDAGADRAEDVRLAFEAAWLAGAYNHAYGLATP